MRRRRLAFPFSAIVGLDKLKLAILINAINPKIGGLLIRGPKGSGKSTIVRSLTDILPKIRVIKDCQFNCSPDETSDMCPICREKYEEDQKVVIEEREMVVVDLPLGATEDRVVGSLDVEKAIKSGIKALEPGILAEANQNILYVDEVNLLPDHIADDLLDVAAMGWNIVEREGISVSHPSRFIFIGTMNPEEGELRPQLLDRFSLSISVETITSVEDRVEAVRRNLEFDAEAEKFCEKYKPLQEELRNRIIQARKLLADIKIPDDLFECISAACVKLKVDGLRPDIVIAKATATLAAFENRTQVTLNDVLVAAELALSHRTREGGFLEPATTGEIKEVFTESARKIFKAEKTGDTSEEEVKKKAFLKGRSIFWVKRDASEKKEERAREDSTLNKMLKQRQRIMFLITRLLGGLIFGVGRRLKRNPKEGHVTDGLQVGSDKLRGDTYETTAKDKKDREKAIPTVNGAAESSNVSTGFPLISYLEKKIVSPSSFFVKMGKTESRRKAVNSGRRAQAVITLNKGKPYGWKTPHGRTNDIHLPATIREASRKQGIRKKPSQTALRICPEDLREKLKVNKAHLTMVFLIDLSGSMLLSLEQVREALLKLHSDAYRSRDRVGIVALKGLDSVVVQHPITNLRVVANKLTNLRISGYTPLAAGMLKSLEVLKEAKRRDPSTVPVMVIITDGSANVPLKKSPETGEVREIEEPRVIVREYEDVAVRDVMSVSRIIRRESIYTVVINTNPSIYGRETYGRIVTEKLASMTKGSHHTIGRLSSEDMVESMIDRIREDQRNIVYDNTSGHHFT